MVLDYRTWFILVQGPYLRLRVHGMFPRLPGNSQARINTLISTSLISTSAIQRRPIPFISLPYSTHALYSSTKHSPTAASRTTTTRILYLLSFFPPLHRAQLILYSCS